MTWQVGDLAVCVDAGLRQSFGPHLGLGLVLGRIYRVEAIGEPSMAGLPTIVVSEVGRKIADRFRKILPDKHEQCEPEFVTLLKRSKVKESASEWLERVGPLAKQLNEEARKEGDKR